MPRLVSPLAALSRRPARRATPSGQAGEDLLRLREKAVRLGQRFLGGQAGLESIGQLGLDQLAEVVLHGNRVDPSPDMATIPLLVILAVLQDTTARARDIASPRPCAYRAHLELRREAGAIGDPALRAAVEAQILAPWLPPEAWAYGHLAEARRLLKDPRLELPPARKGDFLAAPGGDCEGAGAHHGYPGGLSVHTLADLLASRGLENEYRHVYGVDIHGDQLTSAVIWHDALKASTLPWRADGSCGPEAQIAGTQADHVLGLAAAILRHFPDDLLYLIAAAHSADPKQICTWLEAASVLADGAKMECPTRQTVEGFIHHFADSDAPLTTLTWSRYVARAPKGWARFDALLQDGNDVLLFSRSP